MLGPCWRDDGVDVLIEDHLGLLAGHSLVVEVGHQHGGRLDVDVAHAIFAGVELVERGRVDGHGGLGGPRRGRLLRLVVGATLLLAGQRRAAIFGVDGAVVAEQQVAAHKGAAALEALEGAFFGVCSEGQLATQQHRERSPQRDHGATGPASVNSYPALQTQSSIRHDRDNVGGLTGALVAAAVLASAEGAVAELALVLLLRLAGLACSGRSVGGHRGRHGRRVVGGRQALSTLRGELTRMPGARGR